jgi:hypothetical protein
MTFFVTPILIQDMVFRSRIPPEAGCSTGASR